MVVGVVVVGVVVVGVVVVGVVVVGVVVVGVVVVGVVVVGVVVVGVVVVGVVVVGGAVTVQVALTLTELLSLLAFSVNVWVPSARLEKVMGPAQAAGAALSSQQRMDVAFVDVQASVALVLVVEPLGGEARVTVGAGRTTLQL
ncbi:MAG: hypothetical protein WBQ14_03160 [Gaiellaceae bacterium]